MKKILSLALALLIVASTMAMTACGNKDKNPDDPKDPDTENPGTESPDTTDPSKIVFTDVEEYVKATVTVEIRLDAEMDVDNVIGHLRVGEIVARTGISTDGTWSRIRVTPAGFEEGDYYVSTNCLELYTGPVNPEDPENPDDPADPSDPTDPEDPADPTDPEDPEDPADPGTTDPEDPADPETPAFTPVEAYTWGVVHTNVRKEPSPVSAKVTTIPSGTKVMCVAQSGNWIEVIYGAYSGYVHVDCLTLRDPNAGDFTTYHEPKTMVVNTEALTVRYYPFSENISGDVITSEDSIYGYLANGDTVTVTAASADNKWARVQWPDGKSYYVHANYLSGFTGGSTTPSTPTLQFTPYDNPDIRTPNRMSVRYYTTPDTLTVAAGTLTLGDTVNAIAMSQDGVWFKINLSATDTTVYYALVDLLDPVGK